MTRYEEASFPVGKPRRKMLTLRARSPRYTVYDGACISHTPGAIFPSSIARQPRGCQYRTIHLRKALGEMFPNADLFGTDTIILTVEISTTENRPMGV